MDDRRLAYKRAVASSSAALHFALVSPLTCRADRVTHSNSRIKCLHSLNKELEPTNEMRVESFVRIKLFICQFSFSFLLVKTITPGAILASFRENMLSWNTVLCCYWK